jgi:hypothetical protein
VKGWFNKRVVSVTDSGVRVALGFDVFRSQQLTTVVRQTASVMSPPILKNNFGQSLLPSADADRMAGTARLRSGRQDDSGDGRQAAINFLKTWLLLNRVPWGRN